MKSFIETGHQLRDAAEMQARKVSAHLRQVRSAAIRQRLPPPRDSVAPEPPPDSRAASRI